MKSVSRQQRRHHQARMLVKHSNQRFSIWSIIGRATIDDERATCYRFARRTVNNRKPRPWITEDCSKHDYGNGARGLTMQEKLVRLRLAEFKSVVGNIEPHLEYLFGE